MVESGKMAETAAGDEEVVEDSMDEDEEEVAENTENILPKVIPTGHTYVDQVGSEHCMQHEVQFSHGRPYIGSGSETRNTSCVCYSYSASEAVQTMDKEPKIHKLILFY